MKKILNSKIFLFIISGIIFTSIGVYAANYMAEEIKYNSLDSEFQVSNVNDAINTLYDKTKSEVFKIKDLRCNLLVDRGGNCTYNLLTNNYKKVKIKSREYDYQAGTTFFRLYGFTDEECTIGSTQLLNEQSNTTNETEYDISNFKCVSFRIVCDKVGTNSNWAHYYFNGIEFSNK